MIAPGPDDLSRPFWDAAREGRLSLQRCRACGHINHPPQSACGWCSSLDLSQDDVDGAGAIASHTSNLRRRGEDAAGEFTNIVVELDVEPGVYLIGRVDGPRPGWVAIGGRVTVRFDAIPQTDVVLPQFERAPEAR